jgi:dTDP-4-amino-4,6-dideoxygalactose transaminase
LTSTGRAGLTILLRALKSIASSDRNEVVLPSYTCFSVAASVVKAGLRPRIVDIDPATLDYDPLALKSTDCSRALALIATNLYGLPNGLAALSTFAREHHLFLIDDAAQAMGASSGGRPSGSWGDAGLFSLDKGKNVSAIDGGIVVTGSSAVASAIQKQLDQLPAPPVSEVMAGVAKALVYSVMLRPSLYWIPNRIPQLGLGKTVFSTEFPLERPIPALTSLAVVMLQHLGEFTAMRQKNAATLIAGLRGMSGIQLVAPRADTVPVYLRLPILIPDPEARRRALAELRLAGIGASGSYPAALADVRELGPWVVSAGPVAGGRQIADRIVTLPTHPLVSATDIERILEVLAQATRSSSSQPATGVSVGRSATSTYLHG